MVESDPEAELYCVVLTLDLSIVYEGTFTMGTDIVERSFYVESKRDIDMGVPRGRSELVIKAREVL